MELRAVRRLRVDRASVARGLAEHGPGAGPTRAGVLSGQCPRKWGKWRSDRLWRRPGRGDGARRDPGSCSQGADASGDVCVWRCWWEQQPGSVSARNPPCASVQGPAGSPTRPPLGLFRRVGLLPCYGSGLGGPGRQRGWSPTASRFGALGAVPRLPGRCVSSMYQACACSGLQSA